MKHKADSKLFISFTMENDNNCDQEDCQQTITQKDCSLRKSNPRQLLGRQLCYHYTKRAVITLGEYGVGNRVYKYYLLFDLNISSTQSTNTIKIPAHQRRPSRPLDRQQPMDHFQECQEQSPWSQKSIDNSTIPQSCGATTSHS
jgi:hypothetical protein